MKPFKSILELLTTFPDDNSCRIYLESLRWGDTPACHFCGSTASYKFPNENRCRCRDCKKKYSAISGTIFENTKVGLQKWFLAIYLISAHKKGISSLQLGRDLNVTQKTAWFIAHRVRQMLTENEPVLLDTIVEIDETYHGGKEKNKHKSKRAKNPYGRSLENKVPIIGIIQRDGKLVTYVVKDNKASTIVPLVKAHVAEGSTIVTDQWRAYHGLKVDYNHKVVNHTIGEYVVGFAHTNTMEGAWALFKRGVIGIYHFISAKHLHRYCQEFTYRYNSRNDGDDKRFADAIINSDNKRLKYIELTAKQEPAVDK